MAEKPNKSTNTNLVDRLVSLKEYDPTNPAHASIIAKAIMTLSYCTDTMAILLRRTGQTKLEDHRKTFDTLDNSHHGH